MKCFLAVICVVRYVEGYLLTLFELNVSNISSLAEYVCCCVFVSRQVSLFGFKLFPVSGVKGRVPGLKVLTAAGLSMNTCMCVFTGPFALLNFLKCFNVRRCLAGCESSSRSSRYELHLRFRFFPCC